MAAFELRFSKFLFAPNIVPLFITIVVIPLLLSLGFWQLDRADEKKVIDTEIKTAIAQQPINLNAETLKDITQSAYRKITVSGNYDANNQLLLDNRTHQGKPGYHVLSPFHFDGINAKQAVLINRGWIGYQGTRDAIPDIAIDNTKQNISGSIKMIGEAIVLSGDKQQNSSNKLTPHNYHLIQSIQLEDLESQLGYKLLPIVIELGKNEKNGFTRDWQPYYGSVDKHNAYALQWFAMALVVLFLFIKLNIKKI